MNRKNILRVRDAIAAAPSEMVDMTDYGSPDCGTAGCIIGWTRAVFAPGSNFGDDGEYLAKAKLELFSEDFEALCYPPLFSRSGSYTQSDVVETLTRLAETGEVRWPDACPRS